jgi:hypothetical protein
MNLLAPFSYTKTQSDPSGTWVVTHNLGRPVNVDVMIDNVIPGITETVITNETDNGTSSSTTVSNTIKITNPTVIYDSFSANGGIASHPADVGSTWAVISSMNTMSMDGALLHPGETSDSILNGAVNNLVIDSDYEMIVSVQDNRGSGEDYTFHFIAKFNKQNGYGFAMGINVSDVGAQPTLTYGVFRVQGGSVTSFDNTSLDLPAGGPQVLNGNYKLTFKLKGNDALFYIDSQFIAMVDISTLPNFEMLANLCGFGFSSNFNFAVDELYVYEKTNGVSLSTKADPADTYMEQISSQYPNGFSFVNDTYGTWIRVPAGGMLSVQGVDLDETGDFTIEATLRRSFFTDPFAEGAPDVGLTTFGFGGGYYPVFQYKENQGSTPVGGGLLLYYGTSGLDAVQDETLQDAIIYPDETPFKLAFYKVGSMLYTAINGHIVSSVDVTAYEVSAQDNFYILHDQSTCYNFDILNMKITSGVSLYGGTDFSQGNIISTSYQTQGPKLVLEKAMPSSIAYNSDNEVQIEFSYSQYTGVVRVF